MSRVAPRARFRRPNLRQMSLLSATILLLAWLLENFVGENWGPSALLLYLPQHGFAVLPTILLVFTLFQRRWKLGALHVVSLIFWASALFRFNVPLPHAGQKTPTVRVMSYNVARGVKGAENLADVIRAHHPDIVCLQESQITSPTQTSLFPGNELIKKFPAWHFERAGDVLTLSRFPLVSSKVWPARGTRRFLETVWRTPSGDLRVINAHISTSFSGQRRFAGNYWERIFGVAINAQATAQARMDQIPQIRAVLESADEKTPLLLIGDFNTPRRGLFYGFLTSQLSDGWTQAGWGSGVSYPTRVPLLPIDHVFVNNRVRVGHIFFPAAQASDHLPQVADLVF